MGLTYRYKTSNPNRPEGCYRKGSRVYFGDGLVNQGNGAQETRIPICMQQGETANPWINEIGQTCESQGHSMLTIQECWDVAEDQGLVQGWATSNSNRPEGCYRKGYKVFFGQGSQNEGNGAQSSRKPICKTTVPEDDEASIEEDESSSSGLFESEYSDWGICQGERPTFEVDPSMTNTEQCALAC